MAATDADARRDWPPVSYWLKVAAGVIVLIALAKAIVVLRQVLILMGVSLILSMGFQPTIGSFERKGVKRGLAVTIMTLGAFIVIGGFIALIAPTIIHQLAQLVDKAPSYIDRAQRENTFIRDLNSRFDLNAQLRTLAGKLPSTALSLFKSFGSFVFNTLTVLILTLYFTSAMPRVRSGVAKLLTRRERERFERILEESTQRVGGYIIGNITISIIAGVLTFVFLLAIGVPYAAALGFWVALTDLIPTVGAILGALVAGFVAIFSGIPQVIGVVLYFIVYQQVENYLIAPRVMKRAVEMSAAAVIVSLLIGGSLAGFIGALLALPAAAIVKITARYLYLEEREGMVAAEDAAG
ncbi:MAG: AI-2E family transporter [Actinomycetota bacterium]